MVPYEILEKIFIYRNYVMQNLRVISNETYELKRMVIFWERERERDKKKKRIKFGWLLNTHIHLWDGCSLNTVQLITVLRILNNK